MTDRTEMRNADWTWSREDGDGGSLTWHARSGLPEELRAHLLRAGSPEAVIDALREYPGQFGVLRKAEGWSVGVADAIASVPLYVARRPDGTARLTTEAPRLDAERLDSDALLQVALAGYTLGVRTLAAGTQRIGCGEAVVIRAPGDVSRRYYRDFAPEVGLSRENEAGPAARDAAAAVTLSAIEALAENAGGRTILIPLSAGRDSRVIAAGLRHLGYDAVKCFSYGIPGNHEATAAERIARHLRYEWTFVSQTPAQMYDFFRSERSRDFERRTETGFSIPFQQDVHSLCVLTDSGYADAGMVAVNGQSGDFITGNHIPAALAGADRRQIGPTAVARALDALVRRHFMLWGRLATPEALERIRAALREDLVAQCADIEALPAAALYERAECHNRQSKYVVGGQRVHDYLGLDWRLPLWDARLMDFWAGMPFDAKVGQALYAEMLIAENWGGVWGEAWPINRRSVRPRWIAGVRLAVKPLFALLPRDAWRRFDKRVFFWGIDPVGSYSMARYRDVLFDCDGHRSAISWHVRHYLRRFGLDLDTLPGAAGL